MRLISLESISYKKIFLSLVSLWIIMIISTTQLEAAPSTIHTSSSNAATGISPYRHVFRDNGGYYWAFYYDGTNLVYERSDDTTGASWTGTRTNVVASTNRVSTWVDANIVYLTYYSNNDMKVKRGVISAGSISWSSEYVALDGTNANNAYTIASICKDSNGYLWVAGRYFNGSNYRAVAARSTNVDDVSTWGSPTTISSTTTSLRLYPVVVPLSSGDVYVIWYRSNVFEGRKYVTGTGWEGSVTFIANGRTNDSQSLHSAVVDASFNIHLAYIDASGNLQYQKYNGSSWGTLIQIDAATCKTPTVSINSVNNKLYVLWTKGNQIYCKSALNPTSSSDWVSETIFTETTAKYSLTSNYSSATKICWIYTQGTGSPYNVNFDYLSIPLLSVSVSNSTFAFGTNPLNTWMTPQTSVITNDGTVAENFVGRISQFSDGANTWGISSTNNGDNIIRAQWSTTSATGPWTDISAYNTDFTIATNVAVNGSVNFWFRIQTPTSTSSYNQYSSTLTVTAQ
jgi:hypothetical protein